MIKFMFVFIGLISTQVQAKYVYSGKNNLCSKGKIQFFLDGKKHCLDINAPITNSDYDRPIREISNTKTDVRTF